MFEDAIWQSDRMVFHGLTFRLENAVSDEWELGDQCFRLYKGKPLLDLYEKFFSSLERFHPRNVLELGIWDGGSTALWIEALDPRKHVAVDITSKQDSDYFRRYVESRRFEDRVKCYWGVDQADSSRLRDIVRSEFDSPIDLVVDDASHLYGPTKRSFETLFPLMAPGGLYLIEDWAWAFSPAFHAPDHHWAHERAMSDLVLELVEAAGTSSGLISSIYVNLGFVAVERGVVRIPDPESFELENSINRRPQVPAPG